VSTADQGLSHIPASEGESILVMTDLVTVKVPSQATGGIFVLTEVITQPQGGPPMLHRHPDQETFYVLEGRFRFDMLQADQPSSIEAVPGSVIHIPSMTWHNYQNIDTTSGKLLVVMQPGDMLDFFRELGIAVTDRTSLPQPSGPPDMQRIMAITKKHQVEMRMPPPREQA